MPALSLLLAAALAQATDDSTPRDSTQAVFTLCDFASSWVVLGKHAEALDRFEMAAERLRELDLGLATEQHLDAQKKWQAFVPDLCAAVHALGSDEANERGFACLEGFLGLPPHAMLARLRGELLYSRPLLQVMQQEILGEGEALLDYELGEPVSYLWIITREGVHLRERPPRSVIQATCQRVLALASDPWSDTAELTRVSRRLNELLLPPMDPELSRCDSWLIVPDGVLADLPFELLPTESVTVISVAVRVEPRFLLHEKHIRYAPSLDYLLCLHKHKPVEQDFNVRIVGDPVAPLDWSGAAHDDRFSVRRSRTEAIAVAEALALPSEASCLRTLSRETFCRGRRFDLFVGDQATRMRISDSSDATILHLAAHRYLDPRCPWFSGLILSPEWQDDPSSRYLTFAHRSSPELRLSCRLAFLSASATARREPRPGVEPQSVAEAFLAAGARSVIATHWRVSDDAAPILVRAFYQSVLQGMSYASALVEAKLAVMQFELEGGNQRPYSHPFYWANDVLIGE
jgi:hypothetical protein